MLTRFEHIWQRSERGYSDRDMTMAQIKILCLPPETGGLPMATLQKKVNRHEAAAISALGFEGILRLIEIRDRALAELGSDEQL